jgi:hypothetical protein
LAFTDAKLIAYRRSPGELAKISDRSFPGGQNLLAIRQGGRVMSADYWQRPFKGGHELGPRCGLRVSVTNPLALQGFCRPREKRMQRRRASVPQEPERESPQPQTDQAL